MHFFSYAVAKDLRRHRRDFWKPLLWGAIPLIVGGLLVLATKKLGAVDKDAFEAILDTTDSRGRTPWLIYPLMPFLRFNVWFITLLSKLAKLFKEQPWYLKLVLIYVMGAVALLVMSLNGALESLQAD